MKILSKVVYIFSFVFKYVIPVMLFGGVIPFFKEETQASGGLTKAGYMAIAVILFIALKKGLHVIREKPKSIWRGIVLSLPCIIIYIFVAVGINWTLSFLYSLLEYWYALPPFLIIGTLLYIAYEAIESGIAEKETSNGTE